VSSLAGATSHSRWVNPPLLYFWVSIITAGANFLFCLLQLSVDQSTKGDFGPNIITDMINPQWGFDPINNISIIIRILFAVTLFQHSPLTRRVFFNSIRRERSASSVASRGQYQSIINIILEHWLANLRVIGSFSSSATSSFSKECHHHLHQYV
jgi:hypothetical protein